MANNPHDFDHIIHEPVIDLINAAYAAPVTRPYMIHGGIEVRLAGYALKSMEEGVVIFIRPSLAIQRYPRI